MYVLAPGTDIKDVFPGDGVVAKKVLLTDNGYQLPACFLPVKLPPLPVYFIMMRMKEEAMIREYKRKRIMTYLMAVHLKKLWEVYEEDEKRKEQEKKEKEEQEKQKTKMMRKRAKKSCWVQPYLARRMELGNYDNLMKELRNETPELFMNFTRTSACLFDEICEKITPLIEKEETFFRKPLPPGLRLAITLRFLATGETYTSLQYNFRVAKNTICTLVPATCQAIIEMFKDELKLPQTEEEWLAVAKGFEQRWNMPNCIGSMDGKHIRLRNPSGAGSLYFNYKKFFSMVLFALVDSEYRFMFLDVGAIGSECDAGIFAQTQLRKLVEDKMARIPGPKPLPGTEDLCDYYFIGDDAFPLRHYLMKPFPSRALAHKERIYNYRLSRARRTVENAFGILANRFRVFHTSICLKPDNAEKVTIAACILHNMLRTRKIGSTSVGDYINQQTNDVVDGLWRGDERFGNDLPPRNSGRNGTDYALKQRELLRDYMNSEAGSVSWQEKMI